MKGEATLDRKKIHVVYKKKTGTIQSLVIPTGYIVHVLGGVKELGQLKKVSIYSEITNASRYFTVLSSKVNSETNCVILKIYPNQIKIN